MLDHVGYAVSDFEKSKAFYTAALAPLGVPLMHAGDDWAVFGAGKVALWIGSMGEAAGHVHVAFAAPDRAAVRAFHAAAVAAGGSDNGGPGIREQYHPDYYAAFVLDPDGQNIEAVCHLAEAR